MIILYIPNPTQYLNLTTTLLTINKQKIVVYWGKHHSLKVEVSENHYRLRISDIYQYLLRKELKSR